MHHLTMVSWFSFVSTDGSVPKAELIGIISCHCPWGQIELGVLWSNSLLRQNPCRQWLGEKQFRGHWNYFPFGGKLKRQDFGMKRCVCVCYLDWSRLLNRGEKQPVVTPAFFIWWISFQRGEWLWMPYSVIAVRTSQSLIRSWRGLQLKSLNPFTSSYKDGLLTFLEEPGFVGQTGGGGSGGKRAKVSAAFNTKAKQKGIEVVSKYLGIHPPLWR